MTLRILLVTNSALRCGVARYGRDLAAALTARGHHVVQHHADRCALPLLKPGDVDAVLVNWMAGTIPNVGPDSLPPGIPSAVYFHESFCRNNAPRCPLWTTADVVFVPEPVEREGARRPPVYVPMPCPDFVPTDKPADNMILLGNSSIRREGFDLALMVAGTHGWHIDFGEPGMWFSNEDEVKRLAACTANLYLYSNGWGGQSAAVMSAVAARRPIILSRCRQFETLFPHEDELYFVEDLSPATVAQAVRTVLADMREGWEKRPVKLAKERCWATAAGYYERALLEVVAR